MAVANASDDSWANTKSKRGVYCDELASALQKYIRRSNLEQAAVIAFEMYDTSSQLADHLWDRLSVISAADSGDGTFLQPVVINALRQQGAFCAHGSGEGWLFVAHAVRYLCQTPKDTTTDELCMWIYQEMNEGSIRPRIPDYALDLHTKRGQAKGRGFQHFFREGMEVSDELPGRDRTYRNRLEKLIEKESTPDLEVAKDES